MGVEKSGGLVHCVAHCSKCKKQWMNYLTAQYLVRKHVEATGHTVHLESGHAYTYTKTLAKSKGHES